MIVQNKDLREWNKKSFGQRLREVREAHKMTRYALSVALNGLVSEAGIKALELSTNREPHPGTKAHLCGVFIELTDTYIPAPKINPQNGYSYPQNSRRTILVPQ